MLKFGFVVVLLTSPWLPVHDCSANDAQSIEEEFNASVTREAPPRGRSCTDRPIRFGPCIDSCLINHCTTTGSCDALNCPFVDINREMRFCQSQYRSCQLHAPLEFCRALFEDCQSLVRDRCPEYGRCMDDADRTKDECILRCRELEAEEPYPVIW